MKKWGIIAAWFGCAAAQAVIITVDPWLPLFKGIELGHGRQQIEVTGEREHQVLCLRIDLQDPDVQLFTTPHCTNSCGAETLSQNTSHFLEQYGVQAAINGAFYAGSGGPSDAALGTPYNVEGLEISLGDVVSLPDNNSPTCFLFTTNKQAFFLPSNVPPGTNTAGIYTAISGDRVLLLKGTNVQTPIPNDLDPRTALGLSEDRRYLFLLTIDGRQGTGQGVNPPWSDGADFFNTGEWLKRFGAWDGINVDGGGSTTMSMADCQGKSLRLNRPSFVFQYGRERRIGHNFGVYAPRIEGDLKDLELSVGTTTATITWRTDEPASTRVEYGPTINYGSSTALDSRLVRNHVATLSGLSAGSNYFFRAISTTMGGQVLTQGCQFSTIVSLARTQLVSLTNQWRWATNNLDGVNWKAPDYDDNGWSNGAALLVVQETAAIVHPKNTIMPPFSGTAPRTYYFRTHFTNSSVPSGVALSFSNFVDDGAVFYLNGAEIRRLRMPAAPTAIMNSTVATGGPCAGTATSNEASTNCPDIFVISGPLIETNLVVGDNVLAVEVHNLATGNDIVFGSGVVRNDPLLILPRLNLWMEQNEATLFWNGEGFTLQQSTDLSSSANWSNAPGASGQSPFVTTNTQSLFYRLKN